MDKPAKIGHFGIQSLKFGWQRLTLLNERLTDQVQLTDLVPDPSNLPMARTFVPLEGTGSCDVLRELLLSLFRYTMECVLSDRELTFDLLSG